MASPKEILLWFSQEPLDSTTSIRLLDSAGNLQQLGPVVVDPNDPAAFRAALPGPLPAGRFTVSWRTMSDDVTEGLVVVGQFAFTVAAP